jgi:hypothetical protein
MPDSEFYGWQHLEKIEPWGDRRMDLLFCMLMSLIANTQTRDGKFRPKDFLPDWDTPTVSLSAQSDPFEQFEAIAESHNRKLAKEVIN